MQESSETEENDEEQGRDFTAERNERWKKTHTAKNTIGPWGFYALRGIIVISQSQKFYSK